MKNQVTESSGYLIVNGTQYWDCCLSQNGKTWHLKRGIVDHIQELRDGKWYLRQFPSRDAARIFLENNDITISEGKIPTYRSK